MFSTLDANLGYWQTAMDETYVYRTSFVTHGRLYEYSPMTFGLNNAPATFQRAMDVILSTLQWQHALVYLDDIILSSPTSGDHDKHQIQFTSDNQSRRDTEIEEEPILFGLDRLL